MYCPCNKSMWNAVLVRGSFLPTLSIDWVSTRANSWTQDPLGHKVRKAYATFRGERAKIVIAFLGIRSSCLFSFSHPFVPLFFSMAFHITVTLFDNKWDGTLPCCSCNRIPSDLSFAPVTNLLAHRNLIKVSPSSLPLPDSLSGRVVGTLCVGHVGSASFSLILQVLSYGSTIWYSAPSLQLVAIAIMLVIILFYVEGLFSQRVSWSCR